MAAIREYVKTDVVALEATATAADAARVMTERGIGSVGVLEDGQIVGLVTERDLVGSVLAQGCNGDEPIGEAMRRDLPLVSSRATETEALALMRDHVTRHLLVAEDGEIMGLISMRDLVQLMLDEKQYAIEQLEAYIHG
ncbi:MAG TPA: CBS domain-containing protein [Anaeromyxobacteraceae bacterium]|nr:CBS domain-containing protein [Anaeromyxobacteraceae bacterium]